MTLLPPDLQVLHDDWSDLRQYRELPDIDFERLQQYRVGRLKSALRRADASMCLLVNPVSLRYAVDYSGYQLFQSHIPTTYLFLPAEGPTVIHGAYQHGLCCDDVRTAQPLSFFDGAENLSEYAQRLAEDVVDYLKEIGTDNRRIAVEYVNPSITRALMEKGLEVIDGVAISESARVIKSEDEIAAITWAVAIAEHAIDQVKAAVRPGVTELQLWGLLNYTNLANHGNWHDGRMLASGPRINPWLQEASQRKLESGDLVGLDTDMVGPWGYFADISRTFHCGPGKPTKRQKTLYRLAVEEIDHNLRLVRPGMSLSEFQQQAFQQDEAFHENAYSCVIHGVGMCDEYPRVNHVFRGPNPYDGVLEPGMVITLESYVGACGERDGVKLEDQILITEHGTHKISSFARDEALME